MSDLRINDTDLARQQQTLCDRGICVVIPTYNNAGTIVDVVERAMAQCRDVIVVCDGCTDNTVELLESMPQRPAIIKYDRNRGKGTALREGFRYALKRGFAYAITLDGDGQHYPEDISVLLAANIREPGALIVGERKGLDKVERSRGSKFANAFSNFWFFVQTGQYMRDTQTGYRLYPLKKLRGLALLTSRYEAELELMVFASWHGVKLVSEPVNVFYPPREERVSHFRPGKDFMRITILNMVLCLLAVVYGLPLRLLRLTIQVLRSIYSLLFFLLFSMAIMTPLVHLYLLFGKVTERKRYNLHRIFNFAAKVVMYYHKIPGVRYTRHNPHNEDYRKPAVIICNHQSMLDLMPLLAESEKMVMLTADWVWRNPSFSHAIRNAEFYPASQGMESILPQLRSLVERGYSIAIFPEGTRSADCSIGRFHKGAFYVAQELNVDILPLVIYGSGRALPKHGRMLRSWPMHLEIDRRISPDEMRGFGATLQQEASAMRQYYKRRYSEIANRLEQNV